MKNNMLTENLLSTLGACQEGIDVASQNNYFGQSYYDVIKDLLSKGEREFAGWMVEQTKTELYVRATGGVITMNQTYQVFNPLTGTHTEYSDEASARVAMVEISNQVLQNYPINIVQSISNENGDTAWTATTLSNPLTVV